MENLTIEEKRIKTENVLSKIPNVPAKSKILAELSRILNDSSTNNSELSKIIGQDQGLTSKILSIANSPLYGLPRRISTIDFAIIIIGFNDIKNIVIALSILDSLRSGNDRFFDYNSYWVHSVMTANISKRIAEDLGYRIGGIAHVSGLLHDLGIMIIYKYFNQAYLEINKLVNEKNYKYLYAEQEILGYTHAEIGTVLLEKWNLPQNICTAVNFHHTPSQLLEGDPLTSIIHLADYTTQRLELGNYDWDKQYELDYSALSTLKFIDLNELEQYLKRYQNNLSDDLERLNNLR